MPRKTKNIKIAKLSPGRRFFSTGTATGSATSAATRQHRQGTSPLQAPRWRRCIPHSPYVDTDEDLSHRVDDDRTRDSREKSTSARCEGAPDAQQDKMADQVSVCISEKITCTRCEGDDEQGGVAPCLTASSSDARIGMDLVQTEVSLAECNDIMQEQQWKWETLTRNVSELPRDFRVNGAGRRLFNFSSFAGEPKLFEILLGFLPEEDVLRLRKLNPWVKNSLASMRPLSKDFTEHAHSHFKINGHPNLSVQWTLRSHIERPNSDDESLLDDGNTVMDSPPHSSSPPHSASRTPNSALFSDDITLTASTSTTTTPTHAVATPTHAVATLFPVMQLPSLIGLSPARENTWHEFNFFPYPMVMNGHIPENEEQHLGAHSNADERCQRSRTMMADRTSEGIYEEEIEEDDDEVCERCQFSESAPRTALSTPPETYPKRITTEFHVCTFLGAGAFASVHLLRSKKEKPPRYMALKIVEKKPLQERNLVKQVIREFSLQSRATAKGGNSNIIHMAAFFSDDTHCYAMLEYMCNGDLPTLLAKYRNFQLPERTAGFIFGQVLEGVSFIHSLRIVHRDLKPDNIMFDEKWMVKIGDFGWAADWSTTGDQRKTTCGTMEYMAPEILHHGVQIYGAVDLWTCGILLYEMIVGYNPFSASRSSLDEFKEAVVKLRYVFPANMSTGPVELIKRMLRINACYRMPANLALKQAWIDETYVGPLLRKQIPSMLPEEPQCAIMPDATFVPSKLQVNVPLVQQHQPVLFSPCNTLFGGAGSLHFKVFTGDNNMINAKAMTKSLSRPELSSNQPGSSSARECHVPPMPSRGICLSPPHCHDRDWRRIRPIYNYHQPYDPEKARTNFRMPFPLPSPRTAINPTSSALPLRPPGITQAQGLQPQGLQPQGLQPQGLQQQGLQPQGLQPQGLQPQGLQFRPVLRPQPLRDVTPFGLQRDRSTPIDRQSPLARMHGQRVDRIHALHRPIGYATPLPTNSPGR